MAPSDEKTTVEIDTGQLVMSASQLTDAVAKALDDKTSDATAIELSARAISTMALCIIAHQLTKIVDATDPESKEDWEK